MSALLVVGCWAISFIFAGIEAGLLALNPVRLRHRAKSGDRTARRLARLLENPERVLVTVLLATNAADIIALIVVTHQLVKHFHTAGYFLALVIALPIYLFLLGVLPKSLFRRFPLRAVAGLSWLLALAEKVLWPVLFCGERVTRLLFARSKALPRLFAAREELKLITLQSERGGSLTSTERAMIHNVVDFRNVCARDVMTPLAQCITVPPQTPVPSVLELSRSSGHNRFPVIDGNDHAVGQINVLDILFEQNERAPLAHYTRRMVTASEGEPAYRIIRRLRATRVGLAAVVDAQKKVVGIATDSELIKRLVQSV
ncbi:MAG: CNNM domain-containing protein [Verrucomicrobiota bacterium]|nr:CNNM domain-containing protein [Verrucomicrobiota bacterium]